MTPLLPGTADDRLVAHVRPPGWSNPKPAERYDLVALGGGTAGLVSAFIANALGARTALVERELLGGDCLVTGCVPSKALIRSARFAADARRAPEAGVGTGDVRPDLLAALDRVRRLRAEVAEHDAAERLRAAGIDVFFGDARFVAADALSVGGALLRFRRCVLASGARAAVPDIPGLRDVPTFTNETVFSMTSAPRRLLVLGGGPIGCELGQAFARLGVGVTLVQQAARLLEKDDEDAASLVAQSLQRDGVDVRLATRVLRVGGGRAILGCGLGTEEAVACDAILVAAGRRANVEELSLDAAGVALDGRGFVSNDLHLRTSNPRVFVAGDVAGRWQLTHAADAMARVAVQNALLPWRRRVTSLVMPWCTYTDPEVAHVGMTAEQARGRDDVMTVTASMSDVDRAIVDGETEGFARLHVARRGGRILGATLVGSHAGESISEVTLALRAGLSAGTLEDAVHCYPTQAEALRRAAAAWRRSRWKPWMPRVLRRWFRLLG